MSRSAQKKPLARTLPTFAQQKVLDEIAKRGRALPGHVVAISGQIVTVNFDVTGVTLPKQVRMPIATSEYDRLPLQVGSLGLARPAGTYLGGVSGLGGGTADLSLRGNLTTLVWEPIANSTWATPPGADANTRVVYGADALLLLDSLAGHASIKLTATGITLAVGSESITLTSSGITIGPNTTIDSRVFLQHLHSAGTYVAGSTPVTDDSGQVI
jgi:hypothetical protein